MPLYEIHGTHPCANCPTIVSLRERSDSLDGMSIELMDQTTDPNLAEKIATEASEWAGASREEVRAVVESNRDEILGFMNSGLAAIDSERSQVDALAEGITRGCMGPLRMRATDKLGRVVTATICGSPSIITGHHTEVVGIDRESSRG